MTREQMIEEIEAAFKGVTREGGVSWSETRVIDDYGSEPERAAARAQDKDKTWMEVGLDPNWRIDMGVGGFVFLDQIGFSYYLAAGMVAVIRGASSWPVEFQLSPDPTATPENPNKRCAALSEPQRVCVKHFIKHMIQATNNTNYETDWKKLYASYWKQVPELSRKQRRKRDR